MRRFRVIRTYDDTYGKFKAGPVFEGVQFTDGRVALRWLTETASTVIHDSIEDMQKVSVFPPASVLEWID